MVGACLLKAQRDRVVLLFAPTLQLLHLNCIMSVLEFIYNCKAWSFKG